MPDELIDIVDNSNEIIGTMMKREAQQKDVCHRAAHLWIYNSRGEILFQRRSKDKPTFPRMWDISAAGHIGSGDTPENAMLREAVEEIGLVLTAEDLEFWSVEKQHIHYGELHENEFCYIYFNEYNGDIAKLNFPDGEVEEVKFFKLSDVEELLNNNSEELVPHDYFPKFIEEMKKKKNSV